MDLFNIPLCGKNFGTCMSGLILGLRPFNQRERYFVTTSVIGCFHVRAAKAPYNRMRVKR